MHCVNSECGPSVRASLVLNASKFQLIIPGPEADFLEYESRQYNSDLVSHDFIGVPTQYRRDAWDNLWKSMPSMSRVLEQKSNRSLSIAGRFSFPFDKLGLINKSTETHEWWSLPPPRDNEVIAMSEGMLLPIYQLCFRLF